MTEESTNPVKNKKFKGEVIGIMPLTPALVVIEDENGDQAMTIVFMNQMDGTVFDNHGPVDEGLNESISKWINKRNEEVNKKIVTASPEQIKAMEQELKRGGLNTSPGGIIM